MKIPAEWAERMDTLVSILEDPLTRANADVFPILAQLFLWKALDEYRQQLIAQKEFSRAAIIRGITKPSDSIRQRTN